MDTAAAASAEHAETFMLWANPFTIKVLHRHKGNKDVRESSAIGIVHAVKGDKHVKLN